jgi:naphthalene 1,2-dioxygenase system ferredoxin subunit
LAAQCAAAPKEKSMEKIAFIPVIPIREMPEGTVRRCVIREQAVALYHVDGQIYATDDNCTHGLASLADGYLEGDEIECPLHQGVFNVRTGEAVGRPCTIALKTYQVEVEDGLIHVNVD